MGTLMQERLIGGQLVYPFTDANWQPISGKHAEIEAKMAEVDTRPGHDLAQSLILSDWRRMGSKTEFQKLQADMPLMVSMGMDDQRATIIMGDFK